MIRTTPFSRRFLTGLLILAAMFALAGCDNSAAPNYDRLFSNFDPTLKAQIMTDQNLGLGGGRWYAATGKYTNEDLLEQGVTENVIQMAFFSAGGEDTAYGFSHTVIKFEDGIVKTQDVRFTGSLDATTNEISGAAAIHAEVACPVSSDNDGCEGNTLDYEEYWSATWDGEKSLSGELTSSLIPNLWIFELKVKK